MNLCQFEAGNNLPFFLIAGPCVIESESMAMETAGALKEIAAGLQLPFNLDSGDTIDSPSSSSLILESGNALRN